MPDLSGEQQSWLEQIRLHLRHIAGNVYVRLGDKIGGTRFSIRNSDDKEVAYVDSQGRISAAGLPVYANNAAAVAGGLLPGAFYKTGANPDPVCVVD